MTGLRLSELVVITWCALAAALALLRSLGAARRRDVMLGALTMSAAVVAVAQLPHTGMARAVRNLAPAVWVLAAYWISSGFFVAPQHRLERWLLQVDARLLAPLRLDVRLTRGSTWRVEGLELAYLAVYPMLPLGLWAAWAVGGDLAVDRYWLVVFPAEAACYVSLAWWQTRPPRDLEPWVAQVRARSPLRRANEFVLHHGSHRRNTIPSGHAAGAVAVALALSWLGSPWTGVFALLAAAILVATVLGRYHFTIDTAAGALVAVAWWVLVRCVA